MKKKEWNVIACIHLFILFILLPYTAGTGTVSWEAISCALNYRIRYRQYGQNTWSGTFLTNTNSFSLPTSYFNPTQTYEIQLQSECPFPQGWTAWSPTGLYNHTSELGMIAWEKNFGGSAQDRAYAIIQTTDGGYALSGTTYSDDGDVGNNNGGSDYWILKLDGSGNLQWEQNFGGTQYEFAASLIQTMDQGYLIVGRTNSNEAGIYGDTNGWILKLDESGNVEWERHIGGSDYDYIQSAIQTTDGEYILGGYSGSSDGDVSNNNGDLDTWIIKLDINGNIIWERSYGGTGVDVGWTIVQATNGDLVIVGYSNSKNGDVSENNGDFDSWVIRVDSTGDLIWEQNYGGSKLDYSESIVPAADGGFILAGSSSSSDGDVAANNGNADLWIIKIDETGNLLWENNYGGSELDWICALAPMTDGNYALAGFSESIDGDLTENNGGADLWILSIDEAGNLLWEESYGGSGDERALSIIQTAEGGFAIAGASDSDDGDVSNNHGGDDYWIVKLFPIFENNINPPLNGAPTDILLEKTIEQRDLFQPSLMIQPNPVIHSATVAYYIDEESSINLELFDQSGQMVKSIIAGQRVLPGIYEASLEHDFLSPGIYFIRLTTANTKISKKIIVIE